MSKERLDIAIGILDNTENSIERIKNQHKFEKDLSEFLNTNTYSKDKAWVAGMLNQVSEYCKDKIDTLMENQERIAELEEQLKGCIRPKFNRQEHIYSVAFGEIREFIVVAYLDNNITLCEDTATSKLEWCDNSFLVLTKEEAQAKLEELKGENK